MYEAWEVERVESSKLPNDMQKLITAIADKEVAVTFIVSLIMRFGIKPEEKRYEILVYQNLLDWKGENRDAKRAS